VRRTIDLHHEVRRRREAEADAYQLARQDVLTGLPNRRWFTEEFDKWSSEHNGGEVRALFVVDLDNSLQVGVSVGVATSIPGVSGNHAMAYRDGASVHTALRQTDMAMYWAKAEGRGRCCFFDRTMDEKLQQRVELEAEIAGAIEAGQIVPYYQPLVDLATSKPVGFEVLARWRGVLSPEAFISIAEDTGNIAEMTEHLLEHAIRDAKTWPDHLFVSVNFSPRQISDPTLDTRILGLLAKASFPPHRLVIEITESAVVQRLHDAKAVLRSLRNVGVRVALDDFGTGYSGLYHLRELDLDIIKIGRSFVTKMLEKPEEARIVKAIVSLSHALGLHTTAEGIETTQVLDRLVKLGCDTGQGGLFGMPVPAATTATAINEHAGPKSKRRRA
jgi:predicted signal transduction protein with EAL and GGDEF domain